MSVSRGLAALAAVVAVGVLPRLSGPIDAESTPGRVASGSAGMVIYRDPVTGKLGVPPPDVAAQLDPRAARRPAPMVERPGTTPGGGTLLDGAPLMAVTATVDGHGKVSARCDRDAAGEQD